MPLWRREWTGEPVIAGPGPPEQAHPELDIIPLGELKDKEKKRLSEQKMKNLRA